MPEKDSAQSLELRVSHGSEVDAPRSSAAKRIMDLTLGSLLLVIALPIMLIIAVYILVTSGRPVLFRQARVGLHGQKFTMLKFRTMVPEAESMREWLSDDRVQSGTQSQTFKLKADPRIARGGALLRRWSLDELPQIFNVLAGSMSLVGPRPHTFEDVAEYRKSAYERLDVLPGITGPWQVGGRCELSGDESLRLDLEYVQHGSILVDASLLVRTLRAVVSGRGAM